MKLVSQDCEVPADPPDSTPELLGCDVAGVLSAAMLSSDVTLRQTSTYVPPTDVRPPIMTRRRPSVDIRRTAMVTTVVLIAPPACQQYCNVNVRVAHQHYWQASVISLN